MNFANSLAACRGQWTAIQFQWLKEFWPHVELKRAQEIIDAFPAVLGSAGTRRLALEALCVMKSSVKPDGDELAKTLTDHLHRRDDLTSLTSMALTNVLEIFKVKKDIASAAHLAIGKVSS